MKQMKLTREEKRIEAALLRGEYKSVSQREFNKVKRALEAWKKSAALKAKIKRRRRKRSE